MKNKRTDEFALRMKNQRDEYYDKNPQLLDGITWKGEKKDEADAWLASYKRKRKKSKKMK